MAHAPGPVVLVVDDDDDCRALLRVLLGMRGFKVITATDGEEGLALARNYRPCLILLDLMMPGMDGFSFRDVQSRTPEIAQIPVIVISALPDEGQIVQRLGPVPTVAKPIELDELIAKVETLCQASG